MIWLKRTSYQYTRSSIPQQELCKFLIVVNYPRPICTDAESIKLFLCLYEQYCIEVQACPVQPLGSLSTRSKTSSPDNINFSVDTEYSTSAISVVIFAAADYNSLPGESLCTCLEASAQKSEERISFETFNHIVNIELKIRPSD